MDPYRILGIDRGASPEQIRKAYHEKARKHHPDVGGDAWAFQQVGDAYRQIIQERRSGRRETDDSERIPGGTKVRGQRPRDYLRRLAFSRLPLQNETSFFILVSALDIFVTYILLRFGGTEANPVARFFLDRWDFDGMIFFKMGMVAFVTVLAQVIARHNLRTARLVLQFGTLVVALVVAYGVLLMLRNF